VAEDLQANLIRLDQGDRIQPHRNDEVEVLVVVVSGRGELTLDGQVYQLAPMVVAHLPKGTVRAIEAVDGPLAYLSVHRRRSAGLQVDGRPSGAEILGQAAREVSRFADPPAVPLGATPGRHDPPPKDGEADDPGTEQRGPREHPGAEPRCRWDQAARAGGRGPAGRAALTLVAGAGAPPGVGWRAWRTPPPS
jgi:hypothetical protein